MRRRAPLPAAAKSPSKSTWSPVSSIPPSHSFWNLQSTGRVLFGRTHLIWLGLPLAVGNTESIHSELFAVIDGEEVELLHMDSCGSLIVGDCPLTFGELITYRQTFTVDPTWTPVSPTLRLSTLTSFHGYFSHSISFIFAMCPWPDVDQRHLHDPFGWRGQRRAGICLHQTGHQPRLKPPLTVRPVVAQKRRRVISCPRSSVVRWWSGEERCRLTAIATSCWAFLHLPFSLHHIVASAYIALEGRLTIDHIGIGRVDGLRWLIRRRRVAAIRRIERGSSRPHFHWRFGRKKIGDPSRRSSPPKRRLRKSRRISSILVLGFVFQNRTDATRP